MRLEPNSKGKYILLDQEGDEVVFDYGVDASEALTLKDNNGQQRYFMPGEKPVPNKKVEIKSNNNGEDFEDNNIKDSPEPVQTDGVLKREVKTLGKKGARKKGAGKKQG